MFHAQLIRSFSVRVEGGAEHVVGRVGDDRYQTPEVHAGNERVRRRQFHTGMRTFTRYARLRYHKCCRWRGATPHR